MTDEAARLQEQAIAGRLSKSGAVEEADAEFRAHGTLPPQSSMLMLISLGLLTQPQPKPKRTWVVWAVLPESSQINGSFFNRCMLKSVICVW